MLVLVHSFVLNVWVFIGMFLLEIYSLFDNFVTFEKISLGVHILFVQSVAMDSWILYQLNRMKAGGNAVWASYFHSRGLALSQSSGDIRKTYNDQVAQHYKEVLSSQIAGEPEPPLPAVTTT